MKKEVIMLCLFGLLLCGCTAQEDDTTVNETFVSAETVEETNSICSDGNHSWSEVTYTWINSNTACIAKRVCTMPNCGAVEKEVVQAVNQTQSDASGDPELNIKTVDFENDSFESQTETESIEAVRAAFSVSDASGKAGETVVITIDLLNNPGIIAAALQVHYDRSLLKLIQAEDTGLLPDATFSSSTDQHPYYLSWNDALAQSNNTSCGSLVTLTFEILEGAAGQTEIYVTYEPGNVFDWELQDVPFVTLPGTVTIH